MHVVVLVLVLVLVIVIVIVNEFLNRRLTMLAHERLDVYQRALELLVVATDILEQLPRGNAHVADQLNRASMSVPLNIAEGCGKTTMRDKRRFFAIARGSAMECGAIADVLEAKGLVAEQVHRRTKMLVSRLVQMLSKMCR